MLFKKCLKNVIEEDKYSNSIESTIQRHSSISFLSGYSTKNLYINERP